MYSRCSKRYPDVYGRCSKRYQVWEPRGGHCKIRGQGSFLEEVWSRQDRRHLRQRLMGGGRSEFWTSVQRSVGWAEVQAC